VTVTSAAHAAAPSLLLAAALRPFDEAGTGSGARFANELNGITEAPHAPAAAGESLTKATIQQALTLPQPFVEKTPAVLPAPASTAKRPAPNANAAPKQSAEGNQTATVPVPSAPTLEIAPTLTAPATPANGDPSNNDDSDIAVKPPVSHGAPEEVPEPAPPAVTTAGGPAASSPEMAFAARVESTDNSTHSTLPAEMASASAVASANKKIETAGQDETAAPAEPHASMPAVTGAVERTAEPASAPAPSAHATPAAPRAEAPASGPENVSKPSTPLKNISLQVNQPGNERVDVRVVQQGTEVRVSVHSGDATLNSGLRQGLSDLQSRLEETGYRSEMWRPGTSTAPVASAASPQASTNHSRGGDGQPQQQGGSQQEGSRRNPNPSNQPRWVEELESSFAAGENSTGGFYGFSS